MRIKYESCVFSAALMMGLAAVAYGQSPDVQADNLASEVTSLKTENIALREQLNKVEEQQMILLEVVNDLKQRLGSPATPIEGDPSSSSPQNFVAQGLATAVSNIRVPRARAAQQESVPTSQTNFPRYRDGIIIWETPKDAKLPFLLRFQGTTQVRYLNTLDSNGTFTDHLGVTRDVHSRNDITVNRSMTVFGGYIFSKRAPYSFTVWTSAGAASIVVAGNVGWQFSKAFTLTGGYTGVPGSRSLVATFPFFTANDRTMADNFFRPGFTQGVWRAEKP
jgi:hypothetical protein